MARPPIAQASARHPTPMTFLIDTNVVVYAASSSPFRDACAEIIKAVVDDRVDGRISTAILEEIWHLELTGRAPGLQGLARRTYDVFSPLLPVTDELVGGALDLPVPRLRANDRIH